MPLSFQNTTNVVFFLPKLLIIIVMVFHRILDFKTGLNFYSDPIFFLPPWYLPPQQKSTRHIQVSLAPGNGTQRTRRATKDAALWVSCIPKLNLVKVVTKIILYNT